MVTISSGFHLPGLVAGCDLIRGLSKSLSWQVTPFERLQIKQDKAYINKIIHMNYSIIFMCVKKTLTLSLNQEFRKQEMVERHGTILLIMILWICFGF